MARRLCVFLLLLSVWPFPAVPQDLNGNGINDRIDLPGTQPTATLPGGVFQLQTPILPFPSCAFCHRSSGDLKRPGHSWAGSMMGNSARDPVFWSQLDVAEADEAAFPALAGTRDICLRCHIGKGWLEGRSSPPPGPALLTALRGMAMQEDDMFGVQCEICHRLVDRANVADTIDGPQIITPLTLNPDPIRAGVPSTYGNGMLILDRHDVRRGPFTSSEVGWPFLPTQFIPPGVYPPDPSFVHAIKHSLFHRSGNLCGNCHDVSNPAWTPAQPKDNTQANFPIERTWTEWTHSAYPARGEAGNCQSCHMSGPLNLSPSGGASSIASDETLHLNNLHVHDLTGGNTWIPLVIKTMMANYQLTKAAPDPGPSPSIGATPAQRDAFLATNYSRVLDTLFPPGTFATAAGDEVDSYDGGAPYDDASNRATATLGRAAQLAFSRGPTGDLKLRVYNMTGHKLPTGYPEGRRMWLNVKFSTISNTTAAETLVAESGQYDAATGALFHDFNLDNGAGPKSYDVVSYTNGAGAVVAGGRRTQVYEARLHHTPSDVEFHFIRNNEVRSDNRIPPLGWNKAQFIANNAGQTIPAAYSGSQMVYEDNVTGPVAMPPVIEPTYDFDEVPYPVPAATDVADVRLMYQSLSREYLEELVAASPRTLTYPVGVSTGFTRADVLENAWRTFNFGSAMSPITRFPPVQMARLRIALVDTDNDGLPDSWEQAFGLDPASAAGNDGRNGDPDVDGRSNFREFQDGTSPIAIDGVTHPAVDLVLVLDYSGSMSSPAPAGGAAAKIDVLKDAVEIFLRTWKQYATAGGRLGVVYFSGGVTVEGGGIVDFSALPPGTTVESSIDALIAAIRARPAGGSTALGGGLETALQMLLTGGAGHGKHIIAFTNGMQNISPMLRLNATNQYVIRAEPVSAADGVYGDSGVTATPAVPFNTPLVTFGVKIHTIGIGVSETADDRWLSLIRDVAFETTAQNQFISRAQEIEGAFLNNLVESLRGFSPQRIGEHADQLAANATSIAKTFTVDAAATQATFILSWSRDAGAVPLDFELRTPSGQSATPLARRIRGARYVLDELFFPLVGTNGRPIDHAGVWTMVIQRASGRDQTAKPRGPVAFQAYGIADVPKIDFIATFNKSIFKAGERPILTVAVLDNNRPVVGVRRMTAVIHLPRVAVGTLLATTKVSQDALREMMTSGADRLPDAAAAKANIVLGDRSRAEDFAPVRREIVLYDDGTHGDAAARDGIYSAQLDPVRLPGLLTADIVAAGNAARLGQFVRQLHASATIRHADFSLTNSSLSARRAGSDAAGNTLVTIITTPRDTFGNYLGPGHRDRIAVRVPGATPTEKMVDRLDGSYAQTFAVPSGSLGLPATIVIDGTPAFTRPIRRLLVFHYGRYLLLILLLLVILWIVWYLRRHA